MKSNPITSARQQGHLLTSSKEELIRIIEKLEKERASQLDLLKEVYAEREMLALRVKELEKQESNNLDSDGYGRMSSWVSKICFVLQHENRPLRSPELISLLEKREPELAGHSSKEQYFSAFLSNAVSYGRIIQQKVKGVRGYYYLLPSWLDEQGKVLPTYKDKML